MKNARFWAYINCWTKITLKPFQLIKIEVKDSDSVTTIIYCYDGKKVTERKIVIGEDTAIFGAAAGNKKIKYNYVSEKIYECKIDELNSPLNDHEYYNFFHDKLFRGDSIFTKERNRKLIEEQKLIVKGLPFWLDVKEKVERIYLHD